MMNYKKIWEEADQKKGMEDNEGSSLRGIWQLTNY